MKFGELLNQVYSEGDSSVTDYEVVLQATGERLWPVLSVEVVPEEKRIYIS